MHVEESTDGGASWRYLGLALDEPWHLSYPFVFTWRNSTYLLPEGAASGTLRLYSAVDYPLKCAGRQDALPWGAAGSTASPLPLAPAAAVVACHARHLCPACSCRRAASAPSSQCVAPGGSWSVCSLSGRSLTPRWWSGAAGGGHSPLTWWEGARAEEREGV